MKNKELEGLVEEVAKAIAPMWFDEDCQGHWVAGYWEERQKSTIEQAKAVLSVIAPYYEKQIAELKAQIPQWLPISEYSFIKYGDEVLGLIPFSGGEEVHEIILSKSKKYPYWTAYILSLGDGLQPTYFMPKPKPPAE